MVNKTSKKDTFHNRAALLTVVLLLGFLVIAGKLFKLQIVEGAQSRQLAQDQHSIFRRLVAARGDIKITDKFSSEAYPVATNIKHFLVYAVPGQVKNIELTATSLGTVLTLDPAEIKQKMSDQERKYVPLKKNLTEQEQEKIRELKLPGIYFDSEDVRFYPENNLLSHVLGFVGYKQDTKEGLYGLERFYEKDLAGVTGYSHEERDTAGAWIFGGKRDISPAEDGSNLLLTIDKSIQFKAETVLKHTVETHGADSGSVIVVNPKTGAVLAMAGFPDFNPNEYGKVTDPNTFLNEATTGNYEPGSIFKAITMAAAVNEGKVKPETTYIDEGSIEIDGYTIKNSDGKAHGQQTMLQVLDESLNTGVIFAKEQIGNNSFYQYVRKFGFGEKTGIELPEGKGNLDNLKANIKVNFHTATFGQGISVTPIQMIQAFTVFANNGVMMKPFLVQSKISSSGKIEHIKPEEKGRIISEKSADTISGMLVDVVENGHGKKAGVPGYYIAGKTGTAQVPKKDGRGYEEDNNIGSFIGYGPVEDPQFVMIVRINHPRDVSFAEVTAAPAFGEIAKFILNYYNIAPTRPIK